MTKKIKGYLQIYAILSSYAYRKEFYAQFKRTGLKFFSPVLLEHNQ